MQHDDKLDLITMAAKDIGHLSMDTEGYNYHLLGISAAFEGFPKGVYFPIGHYKDNLTEVQQRKLREVICHLPKAVFHSAYHDLDVLESTGFPFDNEFECTLLMSHWVNEEEFSYELDALCRKYKLPTKVKSKSMQYIIDTEGWLALPYGMIEEYAAHDAYITWLLRQQVYPKFIQQFGDKPELWQIEQRFIRKVMIPMRRRGVKVDVDFVMSEYLRGDAIMKKCVEELGFEPSKPTQLNKFLIEDLKLPVVKHTSSCPKCYPKDRRQQGQPVASHRWKASFDKHAMAEYDEMLERTNDKRAQTILTYKGWMKTNSSNYLPYMKLLDENKVLHPGYKLHGTRTGRLSCEKPNLQQIPKTTTKDWNGQLKKAFVPREGFELWTADYAQLQFRMTCAYAEQWDLIEVFNDDSRDAFTEMAQQMAWHRDNVKTLVYLILFGGGGPRAAAAFDVSLAKGNELVGEFHDSYPGIKRVSKEAEVAARKQGFIAMWTGRRRHFWKGFSNFFRAFNAAIQGGEAEIVKRAMIGIAENVCDENCFLVLQIHDEVALEIKAGMADHYLPLVQAEMEKAGAQFAKFIGINIKFKTSVKRWGEK